MVDERQETREVAKTNSPKENSVKFNIGEESFEVDLVDVRRFFTDVGEYNEQFSLGSMMGRMITSLYEGEDALIDEENQQTRSATVLAVTYGDLLDKIGLSLEPVSGKEGFITGQGRIAGRGEMRLDVRDRNRFVGFLKAFQPEQLERTGLRSPFENLSRVLAQQVLDHYNLEKPSDEMLQLFGGLEKIITEYKRLGMAEAVAHLETYLNHARQGDLREYVAIESNHLFADADHFGPMRWQGDTNAKQLKWRWDNALSILRMTKANPRARELFRKLHFYLLGSLKIARQDEETLSWHHPQERVELVKILEKAQEELESIETD